MNKQIEIAASYSKMKGKEIEMQVAAQAMNQTNLLQL